MRKGPKSLKIAQYEFFSINKEENANMFIMMNAVSLPPGAGRRAPGAGRRAPGAGSRSPVAINSASAHASRTGAFCLYKASKNLDRKQLISDDEVSGCL